jgi:hypothetical protein
MAGNRALYHLTNLGSYASLGVAVAGRRKFRTSSGAQGITKLLDLYAAFVAN